MTGNEPDDLSLQWDLNFWRLYALSFQVNGDIPPRLKKSAHEIILEFIRSRPPLNPVSSCYRYLAWNSHSCPKLSACSRRPSPVAARSRLVSWNPTRRVRGAFTSDCWRTLKPRGSWGPSRRTWSAGPAWVCAEVFVLHKQYNQDAILSPVPALYEPEHFTEFKNH